jgi:hypothetical protein
LAFELLVLGCSSLTIKEVLMKAARWMLVGILMILTHALQAVEVKTYLVTVKINDRVVSEVVKARVAGDLEIASQRMIARIRI